MTSLALVVKIDKVSMYAQNAHRFIVFLEKKILEFFERYTAVDTEALWKCRPTKPISSKVPYYLFFFVVFFFY